MQLPVVLGLPKRVRVQLLKTLVKLMFYFYYDLFSDIRETKMSYKDRAEFSPAEHGLDPSFRLTNFTKLKG